jgi:hypothetical protein
MIGPLDGTPLGWYTPWMPLLLSRSCYVVSELVSVCAVVVSIRVWQCLLVYGSVCVVGGARCWWRPGGWVGFVMYLLCWTAVRCLGVLPLFRGLDVCVSDALL